MQGNLGVAQAVRAFAAVCQNRADQLRCASRLRAPGSPGHCILGPGAWQAALCTREGLMCGFCLHEHDDVCGSADMNMMTRLHVHSPEAAWRCLHEVLL